MYRDVCVYTIFLIWMSVKCKIVYTGSIQSMLVWKRRRGEHIWRSANRYVMHKFVSLEIFLAHHHHHHHRRRCRRHRRWSLSWFVAVGDVYHVQFPSMFTEEWQRRFEHAKAITFRCQVLKIIILLARDRASEADLLERHADTALGDPASRN